MMPQSLSRSMMALALACAFGSAGAVEKPGVDAFFADMAIEAAPGQQARFVAEAYRIAHNRYQNGYASYLDELDAQRTLFTTQLNIVSVKNTLLLAQIDLYRALGGGWQG